MQTSLSSTDLFLQLAREENEKRGRKEKILPEEHEVYFPWDHEGAFWCLPREKRVFKIPQKIPDEPPVLRDSIREKLPQGVGKEETFLFGLQKKLQKMYGPIAIVLAGSELSSIQSEAIKEQISLLKEVQFTLSTRRRKLVEKVKGSPSLAKKSEDFEEICSERELLDRLKFENALGRNWSANLPKDFKDREKKRKTTDAAPNQKFAPKNQNAPYPKVQRRW